MLLLVKYTLLYGIVLMLVIGRYEKKIPAMQKDLAARKASAAN